jgi:hypothetical protein
MKDAIHLPSGDHVAYWPNTQVSKIESWATHMIPAPHFHLLRWAADRPTALCFGRDDKGEGGVFGGE